MHWHDVRIKEKSPLAPSRQPIFQIIFYLQNNKYWCRPFTSLFFLYMHVKLSQTAYMCVNDGDTINQHQCQVIIKDPEKKTQDPAGIGTQDLLITSRFCNDIHTLTGQVSPHQLVWQPWPTCPLTSTPSTLMQLKRSSSEWRVWGGGRRGGGEGGRGGGEGDLKMFCLPS